MSLRQYLRDQNGYSTNPMAKVVKVSLGWTNLRIENLFSDQVSIHLRIERCIMPEWMHAYLTHMSTTDLEIY